MSDRSSTELHYAPKALSAWLWRPTGLLAALAIALLWLWHPRSSVVVRDGGVQTQTDQALSRGRDAYRRGDFAEAIAAWRKAAEAGSAAAQNELGLAFETGRGSAPDYGEALKWYRLAANQGDPLGLTRLGSMLQKGRGLPPDYGTALRLFRQAAAQGYAPAMTELGGMYEKGEGAPRDYAAAAKWYLEAWERGGEKWAAYKLAQFYANGLGVAKNEAVANFWNTLASSPAAMCG
jgi:uncharacterized protein